MNKGEVFGAPIVGRGGEFGYAGKQAMLAQVTNFRFLRSPVSHAEKPNVSMPFRYMQ